MQVGVGVAVWRPWPPGGPRLVEDVVHVAHLVVAPERRVAPGERFECIVLPWERQEPAEIEVREQVLVREAVRREPGAVRRDKRRERLDLRLGRLEDD